VIAALYVQTGGCYFGLPDVDPWDEPRDARLYRGPHPVISHTPCPRWGKMWAGSPLVIAQTGVRKKKGDDGGCFAHSLWAARTFGGIIEHPWESYAWPHFGLNIPPRTGGWISSGLFDGGWTCCVEQGRYGHYARKPTLLLAYKCELPSLDWGASKWEPDPELVERIGLKKAKKLGELCTRGGGTDSSPRIGTPAPFRDLLLSIARTACRERIAA
jgi:hypothetical protein